MRPGKMQVRPFPIQISLYFHRPVFMSSCRLIKRLAKTNKQYFTTMSAAVSLVFKMMMLRNEHIINLNKLHSQGTYSTNLMPRYKHGCCGHIDLLQHCGAKAPRYKRPALLTSQHFGEVLVVSARGATTFPPHLGPGQEQSVAHTFSDVVRIVHQSQGQGVRHWDTQAHFLWNCLFTHISSHS